MDRADAAAWIDRYVRAWETNDPEDIGSLFTTDAAYYTNPFAEPWRGQDAIVRGWLSRKDEPGAATFRYEVLATTTVSAIVRGWTHYLDPPREYSNIWLIHFDQQGRCREFTEWWMARPAP
jgi:uncharacterized protein (TIGR02246 family)